MFLVIRRRLEIPDISVLVIKPAAASKKLLSQSGAQIKIHRLFPCLDVLGKMYVPEIKENLNYYNESKFKIEIAKPIIGFDGNKCQNIAVLVAQLILVFFL